ncbi:MAG TPA: MFS transporter [Stellaceae bacterium]|jgi:MFS family permease|nr:MFS transporter [Stellaceae bacterium]
MASEAAIVSASRTGHFLRLALLGFGVSVVPLDSAVNIAFPDITGTFGLPIAMIQWVIIAYVLTHAGLMLAFGRVGDIWSHSGVFRMGLLWSTVAFMLCGSAPSFGWLLGARVLQGIGAGLVLSCAPVLVTSLYPEERRSHAVGVFTLVYSLGAAFGPLIGGVIVARWGWPAVFWFRAPIAFLSLLLWRGSPASARGGSGERFDAGGAVLLAAGLISLLFAVNALPLLGAGNYRAVPAGAVAAASIAGFIWWEGRAARPVVQVSLFRDRRFALINLSNILIYLTNFSIMLLVPYYFSRITTLPLPVAGAVLAVGSAGMVAASTPAGWLVARYGAGRIAPVGALLVGCGLGWVGFWDTGTGAGTMVAAQAIQGIGIGLFQVASMEIVMGSMPASQRGVAGSLVMLTRTIGVVTAASVLTMGFHAFEIGAVAAGADATTAFLTGFRAMFRVVAVLAAATGLIVAWSAARRR